MVMCSIMNRGQILIQVLANYLETGVIQATEVDKTAEAIMQYTDYELLTVLTESHVAREYHYAIKNFRQPN